MKNQNLKLPKSVNILGLEYAVESANSRISVNTCNGLIDHKQQIIYINSDHHADRQTVALLHEIIHGVLGNIGLGEEHNDENLVQSLAVGLYGALKNHLTFSA